MHNAVLQLIAFVWLSRGTERIGMHLYTIVHSSTLASVYMTRCTWETSLRMRYQIWKLLLDVDLL